VPSSVLVSEPFVKSVPVNTMCAAVAPVPCADAKHPVPPWIVYVPLNSNDVGVDWQIVPAWVSRRMSPLLAVVTNEGFVVAPGPAPQIGSELAGVLVMPLYVPCPPRLLSTVP